MRRLLFTRSSTGRINATSNAAVAASADSWYYWYDDLDRLVYAQNAGNPALTQAFSYDAAHNMVSNSLVGSYAYPTQGLGSVRPHAATSAGPYALTGTPLAQLHRRDAWLDYARALVDRVSLRKAAERADICFETSFRWRHRFLAAAKDKRPSLVTGIVEADETLILKSAKGSRGIIGRAPRRRGGKPKKTGTSPDDYDIVLVVRDRHKTTTDHILPDFEGATFETRLDPVVSRDSVLVTDGRPSYGSFAHARGMLHIPVIARRGEHVYEGFHLQNVNAYMSRLKAWMAPFRGVASKYLDSYLGWRRMIERDGERLTPRHAIAEAIGA